jgi:hypothetical protein
MLAELDNTIGAVLSHEITQIESGDVEVSFEAPDREWSGRLSRPTVNCFLYEVHENLDHRAADWQVSRHDLQATVRKGPMRFDVTYHISVWAREVDDEHQLLWSVLRALARHESLPVHLLRGNLKDQPYAPHTQLSQSSAARTNPADLWQAVDNRIRPSITYVVTLLLDPGVAQTYPVVLTRHTLLNDGVPRPTR